MSEIEFEFNDQLPEGQLKVEKITLPDGTVEYTAQLTPSVIFPQEYVLVFSEDEKAIEPGLYNTDLFEKLTISAFSYPSGAVQSYSLQDNRQAIGLKEQYIRAVDT